MDGSAMPRLQGQTGCDGTYSRGLQADSNSDGPQGRRCDLAVTSEATALPHACSEHGRTTGRNGTGASAGGGEPPADAAQASGVVPGRVGGCCPGQRPAGDSAALSSGVCEMLRRDRADRQGRVRVLLCKKVPQRHARPAKP